MVELDRTAEGFEDLVCDHAGFLGILQVGQQSVELVTADV